jgi:hypothetical protein
MQICFTDPDSPEAALKFQQAVARFANLPVVGMIVKVDNAGNVVNMEFAEADTIKNFALLSALEETRFIPGDLSSQLRLAR